MRHVRTLSVGNTEPNRNKRYKSLVNILEGLPRDTLELFEFDNSGSLDYKQMQYLWRSQRSLTNLQLSIGLEDAYGLPTLTDIIDEDHDTLRSLRSVKHLSLKIGETTNLGSLSRLLASLEYTRLEAVSLEFDLDEHTRILDHQVFPVYLPQAIQSMSLTSVALPSESIIKLDSWPNLIDLRLIWCENVAPILANYASPRLVSFVFTGFKGSIDIEETEACAVSSMLSRFQCLQHLKIKFLWNVVDSRHRYKAVGRMAKSIVSHSAHLKSLVYRETSIREHPDKITAAITAAVKLCVNLEELAIWGVRPSAVVRICKVGFLQRCTLLGVSD